MANVDDQAQPQWLSAVIGGYGGSRLCCITSGGEVVRHKSSPQSGDCSGAQPDCQSSRGSLKKRATILFIHCMSRERHLTCNKKEVHYSLI